MVIQMNSKNFCEDYWSPGGPDCTVIAGKIANLNRDSKVLDIGCGTACASINLTLEFGSSCFGIDSESEYIRMANINTEHFGVSDRVRCLHLNSSELRKSINAGDIPNSYDFIIAEGGVVSYVGLEEFFQLLVPLLKPDGVFAMSDLVFREGISSDKYSLPFEIPVGIREFYRTGGYANSVRERSTESQYEETLQRFGLRKEFSFHLSHSHWRKYHTNMKNHALERTGPTQRDSTFIETTFRDECLFTTEAQKYISYLYLIGKNPEGSSSM